MREWGAAGSRDCAHLGPAWQRGGNGTSSGERAQDRKFTRMQSSVSLPRLLFFHYRVRESELGSLKS